MEETVRIGEEDFLAEWVAGRLTRACELEVENERLRGLPTREQIRAAICGDIVCEAGDKCELCSDASDTVMALIKAVQSGKEYEWVKALTHSLPAHETRE